MSSLVVDKYSLPICILLSGQLQVGRSAIYLICSSRQERPLFDLGDNPLLFVIWYKITYFIANTMRLLHKNIVYGDFLANCSSQNDVIKIFMECNVKELYAWSDIDDDEIDYAFDLCEENSWSFPYICINSPEKSEE